MFVASAALFVLLIVSVAISRVGVMGKDWLAGEVHYGEKLSSFFICSSICLVNLAISHARKSD
jgi:hypothetical protein